MDTQESWAQAVSQAGLHTKQAEAPLISVGEINEAAWPLLEDADAIVFGARTAMDSGSAEFKRFADASSKPWMAEATIPITRGSWLDIVMATMIVGASTGVLLAKRVKMTVMPQLVAEIYSLVGVAAVLVNIPRHIYRTAHLESAEQVNYDCEMYLGVFAGAVTISSSFVTCWKQQGMIGGKLLLLLARDALNLAALVACVWLGSLFLTAVSTRIDPPPLLQLCLIALVIGATGIVN